MFTVPFYLENRCCIAVGDVHFADHTHQKVCALLVVMGEERESVLAIINPASAAATAGRFWEEARKAVRETGVALEETFTRHPGDATRLAEEGGQRGFPIVIYVGGDGTANEVANGILRLPPGQRPALASFSRGTGGDLPKSLGLKPGLGAAVERLLRRRERSLDAVECFMAGLDGTPLRRYFINIADAGLGGRVTEIVNNSRNPLGGTIGFLWAIVSGFWSYENVPVRVTIDGAERFRGRSASVVIANGSYFGGGVKIAPMAVPDDGILDILVIADITKRDLLSQLPHIYRGTHVRHPRVFCFRGREVIVEGEGPLPLDIDGEHPGDGPLRARVEPGALRVLV